MGKDDMIKLAKQNNTRIHCVCAMTNGERIDHFITSRDPEIILIFIKNLEGESHWGVIPSLSSLSRLVSSSISKSKRARFICTNCHLNTFRTPTALKNRQVLCFKNEPQLLTVPPKNTCIKFQNYKNIVKCPIKIAADFEYYQPECVERRGKSTEYTCNHKPSGYGFCVVSKYEEFIKLTTRAILLTGMLRKILSKTN